jgi:DNA-binding transcriptional regulator LsrR (DeoR family)
MARKGKGRQTYDEALIFRVADLFFRKMTVKTIAETLGLSREAVYPLLVRARDLELVRLVPPVEKTLTQKFAEKFQCAEESIRVVNVEGKEQGNHIPAAAAELVLGLIKEVSRSGRHPVRLGLGPGRATLDFSKELSILLRSEPDVPQLKLVAITSGCSTQLPQYASTSFFNLFPRNVVEECVGFFAETIVTQTDFDKIRDSRLFKEMFRKRDEIDIVVTAMGDVDDEHDLLRQLMQQAGVEIHELKTAQRWVGNVQYRPFSETAPIRQQGDEMRAVTLFELEDFVKMVEKKHKHVVLMARQCGICGKNRAKALRPLLQSEQLKVWSELVLDVNTARELVTDIGSRGKRGAEEAG